MKTFPTDEDESPENYAVSDLWIEMCKINNSEYFYIYKTQ